MNERLNGSEKVVLQNDLNHEHRVEFNWQLLLLVHFRVFICDRKKFNWQCSMFNVSNCSQYIKRQTFLQSTKEGIIDGTTTSCSVGAKTKTKTKTRGSCLRGRYELRNVALKYGHREKDWIVRDHEMRVKGCNGGGVKSYIRRMARNGAWMTDKCSASSKEHQLNYGTVYGRGFLKSQPPVDRRKLNLCASLPVDSALLRRRPPLLL